MKWHREGIVNVVGYMAPTIEACAVNRHFLPPYQHVVKMTQNWKVDNAIEFLQAQNSKGGKFFCI